jgi:hypothetical protein
MDNRNTKNLPANTAPKGIDIADLIAYRAKGLTLTDIAKLTGCTHGNVSQRLTDAGLESLENFETHKAKVFEHKQREIVNHLTGDKIEKMSAYQAVGAASLLQDKIMALRGQSGIVVEHRHIIADLRDAQDRLRKAGVVIDIEHDDS